MTLLLDAFQVWLVAPVTMLAVSAVYFYKSPRAQSLGVKALIASPGVAATALFLGAGLVAGFDSPAPVFRGPFLALWVVPAVLVGFCIWRFAGPRGVHVLLLPLSAAMLWSLVVGYTTIGGGK